LSRRTVMLELFLQRLHCAIASWLVMERASPVSDADSKIEIVIRIPGTWAHPGELVQRMPPECRLSPEGLTLPDGKRVEIAPMPPDEQFAGIFKTSCRRAPTPDELDQVKRYTVNIGLIAPGGSLESARTMMRAAAVILQAGGAGVFIDNSGLAHGAQDWLAYEEDGSVDALSFAFVTIVQGKTEAWTMGMQIFGQPEIRMRRTDLEPFGDLIINVLRYMCGCERPVEKGHVLMLEEGQVLHVASQTASEFPAGSPMYNPLGSLQLLPAKEIANRN
jgi:hypothetical protein